MSLSNRMANILVLLCSAILIPLSASVPVSASSTRLDNLGYKRTVSYHGQILVNCPLQVPSVKSFLDNEHVDIWRVTPDGEVNLRVPRAVFESAGMDKYCAKISDIESLVQKAENDSFTGLKKDWFESYHCYNETINWYKELAQSDLVTYVDSIGKSLEGRDQPAVHITSQSTSEKKIIYFQCQIHAREWISGATCMYIANYLVENYEGNDQVKALLNSVEFVIVPFVNPDGYEYTWTHDRLWRKNRSSNNGSSCHGVDLNRNYNYHWNEGGVSSDPCSETYPGTRGASEIETQNTENYFRSLGNVVGAIDWHSFGQLILRPYGWTTTDIHDEARLMEIGDEMSARIKAVHDRSYTSDKITNGDPITGTAADWFYSDDANSNNKYRSAGYTIELRPNSGFGFNFLLPACQIIAQGEEIVPAVLYFAESLSTNPLQKIET